MKIIVAGGAGFLGSNLVSRLLEEGHEVTILDSFVSGHERTIEPFKNHPNLKLIKHDIIEPFKDEIIADQIYHLACPASPPQYQKDPVHTIRTCYVGTENLLKLAQKCRARLLLSSTSEIYGDPLVQPQSESYFGNVNSYGPRSCYDEGKRVAEALCYAYQQHHNADIRLARIFNAYGPGMPGSDGRVVSTFVSNAMNSKPINITGDGSAVRCFQYVTDCVSGLIKLMESDYCKPMNIGNDIPCRIDALAHLVVKLVKDNGFKVLRNPIHYSAAPINDPVVRQPDISLAREVLQWRPVVSLDEGIQKTIDWFKSSQNISGQSAMTGGASTKQQEPVPFNVLPITGKEISNIAQTIGNGALSGNGIFSQRCKDWLQENLACGPVTLTASGTTALEMAALVLDIQPGDEVIMPSYTYMSTANAFILRGATVVFVDIRADNMNIDETKIEAAITPKTRAIIPVHYSGIACEMDTIMRIAEKHSLKVVEDAAQALLSTYKGRRLGSIGHVGCVSFHESKNVTSGGQGGAVLINEPTLVRRADLVAEKGTDRKAFLEGKTSSYHWQTVGSSFCMTEIQAAYLWSQLQQAHSITDQRVRLWNRYLELLAPLAKSGYLVLPKVPADCKHNAHIFYICLGEEHERHEFVSFMKSGGITVAPHYTALHSCSPGKQYGRFVGDDLVTTKHSERLVRLPIFYGMSDVMQDGVITRTRAFFTGIHRRVKL